MPTNLGNFVPQHMATEYSTVLIYNELCDYNCDLNVCSKSTSNYSGVQSKLNGLSGELVTLNRLVSV